MLSQLLNLSISGNLAEAQSHNNPSEDRTSHHSEEVALLVGPLLQLLMLVTVQSQIEQHATERRERCGFALRD